MTSWWNDMNAITRFAASMQTLAFLFIILTTIGTGLLAWLRQRILFLRNEKDVSLKQRLQAIEKAAENIRKELMSTQQDKDIVQQRLKVMEDATEAISKELIATKQKQVNFKKEDKKNEPNYNVKKQTVQSEVEISSKTSGMQHILEKAQRKKLIEILKSGAKGEIDIIAVMDDNVSQILAQELDALFKSNGWLTNGVVKSAFAEIPSGIILAANSKHTAPSYASFLQRTFITIGVPVSAATNNKYREWSLTLIAGDIS